MIISQAVAEGGITAAIAILDYIHAPAVAFYFLGAQLYSLIKVQKPAKIPISKRKRRAALGLLALIWCTYIAQAGFYLSRALGTPSRVVPEHSGIHVLGATLIFLCLPLAILSNDNPIWHPHIGSWLVGFSLEATLCGLHARTVVDDVEGSQVVLGITAFRLATFGTILVNGILIILGQRQERHTDEERQSLLGNGEATETAATDGSATPENSYGTTTNAENGENAENADGDDDADDKKIKEQQQKRLEEHGGWVGYLKGFSIFLPYVWPKNDWKGKVCILVMAYDIISDRIFNVLVPRQIGIVTDKLARGGPMPWKETLVWFLLKWLPSSAGTGAFRWVASNYVENYSYQRICDLAFNHVMALSMDFHANKDSGEVLKSVDQANSLNSLLELVLDVVPIFLDFAIGLWYVTHLFDVYLAFIVLVLCVFYVWISITMTAWAQPPRRTWVKNNRNENKTVLESISNWQTVTYFNRSEFERDRYKGAVQLSISSYWTLLARYCYQFASQSFLMQLGFASCTLIAVWEISVGRQPVGNFVTFIMYWGTIVNPLYNITSSYKHIASSLVDAERVLQLLMTKPSVQQRENASELIVKEAKVEFDNVDFAYDTRKPVLKSVNFVAEPGKTVALVGETGGGKSTILKLLFRFYDTTGGSIRIDGQDLKDVSLSSLREVLGVVPQDPSMFNQSIRENIRYARLSATDEEIEDACKAAAVHDKIMTFPDGYKSKVGERGVKLSGGELQRVAIARVLVKNPRIVMLDEATSAVDSATEQQIQEAFKQLSAGRTTFVVAHRLSTIMEADLIIVIDHGEIVERGTHEELLLKGGKYLELWTKQTTRPSKSATRAPSRDGSDAGDKALINDLPKETYAQELAKSFGVTVPSQTGEGEESTREATSGPSSSQPLITLTPAEPEDETTNKDSTTQDT